MTPDTDLDALTTAWQARDFTAVAKLLARLEFRNMVRRVKDQRQEATEMAARLGGSLPVAGPHGPGHRTVSGSLGGDVA